MARRLGVLGTVLALLVTLLRPPVLAVEIEPPDARVAYTWSQYTAHEDGSASAWARGIATMRLDGSERRVLTAPADDADADADPAWSPDARYIAYSSYLHATRELTVRIITRDGGEPIHVDAGSQPSWSPDGRFLAYVLGWGQDGAYALAITPVDLSGPAPVVDLDRRITIAAPRPVYRPAWSPDGDAVAYYVDKYPLDDPRNYSAVELYRFDLADEAPMLLSGGLDIEPAPPSWSPTGDSIAVLAPSDPELPGHWRPWLVAADGSGASRLGAERPDDYYFSVRWAPHGLFLVAKPSSTRVARLLLPDGTIGRDIDLGVSATDEIEFSPDGLRLLVVGEEDPADPWEPDLFSVSIDGSDRRRLSDDQHVMPNTVRAISPGLTVRLLGPTRIETAVALCRAVFTLADTVLLARTDAYADALVAGPLAASLGAPLLLTTSDRLHPAVAEEVHRLGARRAILIGDEAALSGRVESDVRAAGATTVERIGGDDRFDVAAAVAARLPSSHAYVVEGVNPDPNRGWPDAVAVSALAAYQQRPILLVSREAAPSQTLAAIRRGDIRSVIVVGGPAAVSEAVVRQLRDAGATVSRLAGDTRYDTSIAVAERSVEEGLSAARTTLVTGRAWPDALAAGPAVARRGGTVVLVDGHDLRTSPATVGWLEWYAGSFEHVTLIGGSAAITPAVAVGVEVAGAG